MNNQIPGTAGSIKSSLKAKMTEGNPNHSHNYSGGGFNSSHVSSVDGDPLLMGDAA